MVVKFTPQDLRAPLAGCVFGRRTCLIHIFHLDAAVDVFDDKSPAESSCRKFAARNSRRGGSELTGEDRPPSFSSRKSAAKNLVSSPSCRPSAAKAGNTF